MDRLTASSMSTNPFDAEEFDREFAKIVDTYEPPPDPEPPPEPEPPPLRAVPDEPEDAGNTTVEEAEEQWPDWWADLDAVYEPGKPIAGPPGTPVLIAERHHVLFGAKSTGKSTTALVAADQVINDGGAAIYLSWEMKPSGIRQRLDEIGLSDLADHPRFKVVYIPTAYKGGDDRPADVQRALQWAEHKRAEHRDALVVIDSVARAGGATNSDDEYIDWLNRNIRPWEKIGATVLLIDHVMKRKKDDDDLFYGPRGTGAKIDQADIALNAVGPPWTTANKSEISLVVIKDRYSDLNTPEGRAAAVVEGTPQGNRQLRITIRPPAEADHQRAKQNTAHNIHDNIDAWFRNNPEPISRTQLAKELRKGKDRVLQAVTTMIANGKLAETDQGICARDHF